MKVFKFGGASVKDAASVKNVAAILSLFRNEKLVVVISAMGKTTNALEKVVNAFYYGKPELKEEIAKVKMYHMEILSGLGFMNNHKIYQDIDNAFTEMEWVMEDGTSRGYAFIYDQIVSQGELMSTKIMSAYLQANGFENQWLDARDVIHTDNTYREGRINWELTEGRVNEKIPGMHKTSNIVLTQGFIGTTSENFTTTLGREGSDYTAAIISYCLNAEEMVVWKDVPGVLSADPKFYSDAVKLQEVSYLDAIELTYYGATVIHPKTIKPLENKNIPLRVRSFLAPKESGTSVGNYTATKPLVPCFIFKTNQILLSISAKDFSFVAEDALSRIFKVVPTTK